MGRWKSDAALSLYVKAQEPVGCPADRVAQGLLSSLAVYNSFVFVDPSLEWSFKEEGSVPSFLES